MNLFTFEWQIPPKKCFVKKISDFIAETGNSSRKKLFDWIAETGELGGKGELEPDQLYGDATNGGDQVRQPYPKTKTKGQRQNYKDKKIKTKTKRPGISQPQLRIKYQM